MALRCKTVPGIRSWPNTLNSTPSLLRTTIAYRWGVSHSTHNPMGNVNLNHRRQPLNEAPILVFCTERGHIADLKKGLCHLLSRYYSMQVAVSTISLLTYQYHFAKDRKKREILIVATDIREAALLYEVYGRLSQQANTLQTLLASYSMTVDGHWDMNIAHALFQHHFWTDFLFEDRVGLRMERHRLN